MAFSGAVAHSFLGPPSEVQVPRFPRSLRYGLNELTGFVVLGPYPYSGDSRFRASGNHDRHRIHSATVGCGNRASSLVRTTTVTSPTRATVAVAVAMLRLPGLREITLTPNFNNESAKIVTWEPDAVILAIPPAGV